MEFILIRGHEDHGGKTMKADYLVSLKEALNKYTNNYADIKDILKD